VTNTTNRSRQILRPVAAALLCLLLAGVVLVRPASSTIPALTPNGNNPPAPNHWDFTSFPVTWDVNPSTGSNITGSTAVADVMQTGFSTWMASPNAAVAVSRGPDSNATSAGFDSSSSSNINLICFVCQGDFSKDVETLAVTITTIENSPGGPDGHGGRTRFVGQILDADILFNPNNQFSTGGGTGQDMLTVATHEIGHFLGLDHSAIVRAVMFPFAPPVETTLSYDDVAGISALYPKSSPDVPTGAIAGSVHMGSGSPVFGAHVFAESQTAALPFGSAIRKTPIGTMTAPDGTYTISGLPADSYIVVAEPLDEPVSNADVESYPKAFHQNSVQTGFTTRWH
jgi:hypothetical protein